MVLKPPPTILLRRPAIDVDRPFVHRQSPATPRVTKD
jgi:hypothetical protein